MAECLVYGMQQTCIIPVKRAEREASPQIASACTNPLVGRLATLFRPTSLFLVCTLLFTTGAAITGVASSLDMFLVGRVIAGCGGAGLFTTCNILLLEGAPEKRRGVLIGIINAVMTVGSCLGPVIAGALSTSSWGWVRLVVLRLYMVPS